MTEKGCQILVIDDLPEMEDLLKLVLAYERQDIVRYAPGGKAGLAAAEQNPPDLIILDVMMPEFNGYDVCRQLKATPRLKNIPVLFLTVVPPRLGYDKTLELGGAGYICKPYGVNDILAARDAVLRGEIYFPGSIKTLSRW